MEELATLRIFLLDGYTDTKCQRRKQMRGWLKMRATSDIETHRHCRRQVDHKTVTGNFF